MAKKDYTGPQTNQVHASTLKKRSFKGRQVAGVKGGAEPAWLTEAKERAEANGVKPTRSWGR